MRVATHSFRPIAWAISNNSGFLCLASHDDMMPVYGGACASVSVKLGCDCPVQGCELVFVMIR